MFIHSNNYSFTFFQNEVTYLTLLTNFITKQAQTDTIKYAICYFLFKITIYEVTDNVKIGSQKYEVNTIFIV